MRYRRNISFCGCYSCAKTICCLFGFTGCCSRTIRRIFYCGNFSAKAICGLLCFTGCGFSTIGCFLYTFNLCCNTVYILLYGALLCF
nr:MAG TPA: hypothetical protein [Caudoviricetes sp.]